MKLGTFLAVPYEYPFTVDSFDQNIANAKSISNTYS